MMDNIVLIVGGNNPAQTIMLFIKLWVNLFTSTISIKIGLNFQKGFFVVGFESVLAYEEKLKEFQNNSLSFIYLKHGLSEI